MRIYLIRHGRQCSKLCNVDVPLDSEGRRQAALMGERLRNAGIEAVYSSDMLRAVETAKIANEYWKAPLHIRPELREISFGEMEGMSDGEIAVKYADFQQMQSKMEEDLPYPGGECAGDVVKRALPVFEELTKSELETVAMVVHGGVIRSMASYFLGLNLSRWRTLCTNLENCGVTELRYHRDREMFTIERLNDYAHLETYPELLRSGWAEAEN